MQTPKKLEVYQEAYDLATDIFKELEDIKGHFRLREQLTASSTSICANLGEFGSFDNKNQQKYKLSACIGEANETEFWLDFCKDTGLISEDKHKDFVNRNKVVRMKLFNLKKRVVED